MNFPGAFSIKKNRPRNDGYVLIMLMMVVLVMSLALLTALPVWQTELQREKEEELIFRGKQYVEAVRLYQLKNPGRFPSGLKELEEKKYIRKLYPEPMTEAGTWNLVLAVEGFTASIPQGAGQAPTSAQQVLVAPESALESIQNPRILGVVSPSGKKSFKIYMEQESYDKWLFYYGQDPNKMPKIIYFAKDKD